MSVAVFDYNGDGAPDLYLSDDGTPNLLLVNDGKGHFKDMALQAGVAFNAMGEAAGSMAATIGDCNGDGLEDILVTRLGYGSLYMGTTNGVYDDRMMASGLGSLTAQFVGWGGCFLDYDNSGKLDIFIANGDPHYLRRLGKSAAGKSRRRHVHGRGGQGRRVFHHQNQRPRQRRGGLRQRRPHGHHRHHDWQPAFPAAQPRQIRQPLAHARPRRHEEQPRRLRRESEGDRRRQNVFRRIALRVRLPHAKRPPPALRPGQGDERGPHRNPVAEQTGPGTDQRQEWIKSSRSANPASGNNREHSGSFKTPQQQGMFSRGWNGRHAR